jgi:hypothetical protein
MTRLLPLPPAEYLAECFRYEDGVLFWRRRPDTHFKCQRSANIWNSKFPEKRAGRQMPNGAYRQVAVDGIRYLEHRVVAAMHNMPLDQFIDHRDRCGDHNRIENLRPATPSQNMRNNSGWSKKSSRVGVHQKQNGRWTAYIRTSAGHLHLGTFLTEERAIEVRREAEATHYGEFAPA